MKESSSFLLYANMGLSMSIPLYGPTGQREESGEGSLEETTRGRIVREGEGEPGGWFFARKTGRK